MFFCRALYKCSLLLLLFMNESVVVGAWGDILSSLDRGSIVLLLPWLNKFCPFSHDNFYTQSVNFHKF